MAVQAKEPAILKRLRLVTIWKQLLPKRVDALIVKTNPA